MRKSLEQPLFGLRNDALDLRDAAMVVNIHESLDFSDNPWILRELVNRAKKISRRLLVGDQGEINSGGASDRDGECEDQDMTATPDYRDECVTVCRELAGFYGLKLVAMPNDCRVEGSGAHDISELLGRATRLADSIAP